MAQTKPSSNTTLEVIRTISGVVTAICLMVIMIEMLIAGVYATKTIHHLHSTYHPEQLASIIGNTTDILQTLHKTTHTFQEGEKIPIFDELDRIANGMQMLAGAIQHLQIETMIQEASAWRNMSKQAVINLKKTLGDL
tara:strand:- start:1861 stop:2274 length:414 start_codon:yes stop_codon:yes gene_type:complete